MSPIRFSVCRPRVFSLIAQGKVKTIKVHHLVPSHDKSVIEPTPRFKSVASAISPRRHSFNSSLCARTRKALDFVPDCVPVEQSDLETQCDPNFGLPENRRDFSVRLVNPVTCRPTHLPSQSSAAPPIARALSPSAPWQLFPTDARPVRPHPEMRRRWRRWLGQVGCRTKPLSRAPVAPTPARRAGIWRLRSLCPALLRV